MVQEDCCSVEFSHKYTYIYQADGGCEPLVQVYQSHAVDNPDHTRILYYQTEKVHQPLRFQGQYFDQEISLHYNTFRYYDPHVGRFIT